MTNAQRLTVLSTVILALGLILTGKAIGSTEEIETEATTGIKINQVTAGWYDQKISDGKYSETEVPFGKIGLSLGSIADFDFDGDIEYITDGFDRVDYTVGTTFKDVKTNLVIKSDSRKRTGVELDALYELSFIPFFDAGLKVSIADNNRGDIFKDMNYLPSIMLSKGLHNELFDANFLAGGEIGKSFNMTDNYDYQRLFVRFDKVLFKNFIVFGEANWLTNDNKGLDYDRSFYAGISSKF